MYFVDKSYITKLTNYGLTPVFIVPGLPETDMEALYREASGALYIGGADINPALYQQRRHAQTDLVDPYNDFFGVALLKRILTDRKPFLGICRGCQLLSVAAGGTLYQHLPEITGMRHSIRPGQEYGDLMTNSRHQVNIVPRTKSVAILGNTVISTNSGHHQSICDVGKGLRPSAYASDGVIEMIEHLDPDYFCFGIQAHPEIEENGPFEPFFEAFSRAVMDFQDRGFDK